MKRISLVILTLSLLVLFSGCGKDVVCKKGSGSIATKTLVIPSFSGIDVLGSAEVFVSQGVVQEVILEGDDNVIERMGSNVKDGNWQIELLEQCFKNYQLTVTITLPDLKEVNIDGSGEVLVNDFIGVSNFSSNISGSGELTLNKLQSCQTLEINIDGSGDVESLDSSKVVNSNIHVSGSGEIDLFMVEAENCSVNIPGSGNVKVNVVNELDVSISGSGEVGYKGYPIISTNISGSGNIIDNN